MGAQPSQESGRELSQEPGRASRRVVLCNKRGLHARASAKFVKLAETFKADIRVRSHNSCGEEEVVADSIMELLMLGSACDEAITIMAQGPDAERAVEALARLVENQFGEGE